MPLNAYSVTVLPRGAHPPADVAGCCAEIDRLLAPPWTHDEAHGAHPGRGYDVTALTVEARGELRALYVAEHWRVGAEPGPPSVPMQDRDRVYFRFRLPVRGGEGAR